MNGCTGSSLLLLKVFRSAAAVSALPSQEASNIYAVRVLVLVHVLEHLVIIIDSWICQPGQLSGRRAATLSTAGLQRGGGDMVLWQVKCPPP